MGRLTDTWRQHIIIPQLFREIYQSLVRIWESSTECFHSEIVRGGLQVLEALQLGSGPSQTLRDNFRVEQLVHRPSKSTESGEKGPRSHPDADLQRWGEPGAVLQAKIIHLSRLFQIKHRIRPGWPRAGKCHVPPMREKAARDGYRIRYSVCLEEPRFWPRRHWTRAIHRASYLTILGTRCQAVSDTANGGGTWGRVRWFSKLLRLNAYSSIYTYISTTFL